jgi:hypothetical protein
MKFACACKSEEVESKPLLTEEEVEVCKEELTKASPKLFKKMIGGSVPLCNPYNDKDCREYRWHAVVQDRSGDTKFIGAKSDEDLKVALSNLTDIKKVLMIVQGCLIDFSEERSIKMNLAKMGE